VLGLLFVPAADERPSDGNDITATERTTGPVFVMPSRKFVIPFPGQTSGIRAETRFEEVKRLVLQVSTDEGRTWSHAATADPDIGAFAFFAPADALYGFRTLVIHKNGDVSVGRTSYVRVQTEQPRK
jgi:hypothetical protein